MMEQDEEGDGSRWEAAGPWQGGGRGCGEKRVFQGSLPAWPSAEPPTLMSASSRGSIPEQFRQTHWWETWKALSCSEESKDLARSQTTELSIL